MDTRRLRIDTSNMMNMNSPANLMDIRDQVLKNLSQLQPPSGAAISEQPGLGRLPDAPEPDPDVRGGGRAVEELRAVKDGYDSDDEGTGNLEGKHMVSAGGGVAPEGRAGSATGSGTGEGAVVSESSPGVPIGTAPTAAAPVDAGAATQQQGQAHQMAPGERPNGTAAEAMDTDETGPTDMAAGTVGAVAGVANAGPVLGNGEGGSSPQEPSGLGHTQGTHAAGMP
jgi:hypothetical protein